MSRGGMVVSLSDARSRSEVGAVKVTPSLLPVLRAPARSESPNRGAPGVSKCDPSWCGVDDGDGVTLWDLPELAEPPGVSAVIDAIRADPPPPAPA